MEGKPRNVLTCCTFLIFSLAQVGVFLATFAWFSWHTVVTLSKANNYWKTKRTIVCLMWHHLMIANTAPTRSRRRFAKKKLRECGSIRLDSIGSYRLISGWFKRFWKVCSSLFGNVIHYWFNRPGDSQTNVACHQARRTTCASSSQLLKLLHLEADHREFQGKGWKREKRIWWSDQIAIPDSSTPIVVWPWPESRSIHDATQV